MVERELSPTDVAAVTETDLRDVKVRFGWQATTQTVLLTQPEGNPKSHKAAKFGYSQAILMLHSDRLEVDTSSLKTEKLFVTVVTCPHATHGDDGCVANCIMYTGRGQGNPSTNPIIAGRAKRTEWLALDPWTFIAQLVREMNLHVKRSKRLDLTPVFRLNGTSDLRWEQIVPWLMAELYDPEEVVFLDYTKWPLRARSPRPSNYHLAKSVQASHDTIDDVRKELRLGHISMICDDPELLIEKYPKVYVDGDESDLWMAGVSARNVIGLLKPKSPMGLRHPQVFQARDLYDIDMLEDR